MAVPPDFSNRLSLFSIMRVSFSPVKPRDVLGIPRRGRTVHARPSFARPARWTTTIIFFVPNAL
jgi:hypothetical protein